jgi:hypothetical protein
MCYRLSLKIKLKAIISLMQHLAKPKLIDIQSTTLWNFARALFSPNGRITIDINNPSMKTNPPKSCLDLVTLPQWQLMVAIL